MLIEQSEYERIISVFPRACVDILVTNQMGRCLLLKRVNEPASGEWWFPGGRVFFGESRMKAAERILLKECALRTTSLIEMGTFDLIYLNAEQNYHDVVTLFKMKLDHEGKIITDSQSSSYVWCSKDDIGKMRVHHYISNNIKASI